MPAPQETCLSIRLPAQEPRSYDILIGENLLAELGTKLSERLGQRRCLIVSETNVAPLYLKAAEDSLTHAGHTLLPSVIVPAGEGSKSFACLETVTRALSKNGADRKTLLVALGGGVIGDLAGFAASCYMRGIDFIQVPTTLLAQTDSSVGGKTGIDIPEGKNLVGAFHQPRLVLTDLRTLDTLPEREQRGGYGEIVKYGLIFDRPFFGWCKDNARSLLTGDPAARQRAVSQSCLFKARIIEADERESGQRALLNLGHTFGHALEAACLYDPARLLHGEAVAIGTLMAFRLSVALGLCPLAEVEEIEAHFKEAGLPTTLPALGSEITAQSLTATMASDKKAESGHLTLILAKGIGQAFIAPNVDKKPVLALWREMGIS